MTVHALPWLTEREIIVTSAAGKKTTRLRVAENRYRQSCRIVDTRSGGVCEGDCDRRASEHHHRTPRGMGGSSRNPLIHRASAIVHLCGIHHAEAEAFPARAFELGFRVRRGRNTENAPLYRRGEWVVLSDDGGVTPCDPKAA